MKRQSIRKFSIVGLLLMGASAVTAAFIPSAADKDKSSARAAGVLIESTDDAVLTCTADAQAERECNATTVSGSTGVGANGTITTIRGSELADTTGNTTIGD